MSKDFILSPGDSFILICPECRILAFDPKICVNCGAAIPPSTKIKVLNKNNKVYEINGYYLNNFSKSTVAFFNETEVKVFKTTKEATCRRSDTKSDARHTHGENCACVKYLKTEDEVKKSRSTAEVEDVVMEKPPDEEREHPAMDSDCAVEKHNSHPVLASNSLVHPTFGGISVNEDLARLADGKTPNECMTDFYFKSDTESGIIHTHDENWAYLNYLKTVSWVLENNFTSNVKDTHEENWAYVKYLKTEEEDKRSYLTAKQDEVMEVANEEHQHPAEEHERLVEDHNSHPMSTSNSVVHPAIGSVPINDEDIACLADGEMLNDSIIDFYLNYIYYEMISWEFQVRTHIFSSFFYKFLLRAFHQKSTKSQLDIQKRVNKWIRNVDIFSKDFIFVPINIPRKHWYLAVVCFLTQLNKSSSEENISERSPAAIESKESSDKSCSGESSTNAGKDNPYLDKGKPCICFFDSYDKSSNVKKEEKLVAETLKQFFKLLWKNKNPTEPCDWDNLLYYKAVCPQQDNTVDCGLYLLQYVETFFKNPIPYFGNPMPTLKNWFPKSIMIHKREEIKKVISELKEKQPQTARSESSCSSDVIVLSTDD